MFSIVIRISRDLALRIPSKTIFALLLSALCSAAFAVPPALPDQNGKPGGMEDFSGKPVMVFVTSLTKMADL